MGAFLSYSLLSGIVLLALYLVYRLCLSRCNQHSFNRAVLLGIYGVSMAAVPLAALLKSAGTPAPRPVLVAAPVAQVYTTATTADAPVWGTVVIWIFMAGMAAVAVHTAITWARLCAVIRRGQKIRKDGYTLVVTPDDRYTPFSWMHYVVISRADYAGDYAAIAVHELRHVAARHWLDLLVAQAVCIVNWFNPAAWLMRDELMLVHEYHADMAVIDSGHDTQEYQLLLIRKAVGARFPSLANSLNHSKLKKRITMMYKEKSGAGRRFRALALVPVLALALAVASMPAVRAAVSTISSSGLSTDKGSKKSPEVKTAEPTFRFIGLNNNNDKTRVFLEGKNPGHTLSVSGGTFTTCGKTYQASSLRCVNSNDDALIEAEFPFLTNFENTSLTLNINGKEVTLDLEEFFGKAQPVIASALSVSTFKTDKTNAHGKRTTIIIDSVANGITSAPVKVTTMVVANDSVDGKLFIDGREVNVEELKALPTEDIASVEVNKQTKALAITTKTAKTSSGMRILLDGREISQDEMNAYPAEKIASITVDKQANTINITSEK